MKLTKKLILFFLGAGAVFSLSSAFAEPAASAANNNFYVSADVGAGKIATPDKNLADPQDNFFIDHADYQTGASAIFGASIGYQRSLNPYFLVGAEAGYENNGKSKYSEDYDNAGFTTTNTYKITSTDLHLLGTGMILFKNGFNIFAKAGEARVRQEMDVRGTVDWAILPFPMFSTVSTGYKPMAAAGLGYRTKIVDVYFQYSHIFGKDAQEFSELFNSDGSFADIVSADAYKAGLAFNITI